MSRPFSYLGVDVWPYGRNTSGMRYLTNLNSPVGRLRAETKAEMKQMIRERLFKPRKE
jgi:hypothetical protein